MWTIRLKGVVQGVGFRPAVARTALRTGAKGFVRNDGSHVTIGIDIEPSLFLRELSKELGPMARIDERFVDEGGWEDLGGLEPVDFRILPSKEGERDSSLPYDTAICDRCLAEMIDPSDRRYLHPFTNCTDCGARYTLIDSLPYDRERTSMAMFTLCPECTEEYSDHEFRRYHAQTLSCQDDGPSYRFMTSDLKVKSTGWEAFLDCARAIKQGDLLIVKGWGGMHIVSDPGRLEALRKWYGRPHKPFALMVRDMDTARSLGMIGDDEERLLSSPAKSIVLVGKGDDPPGWAREGLEMASPGLGNVGLYLPYSGIHHLLFKALDDVGSDLRWIVMTSANPPGEPMALELEDAVKMKADGYFVHDRRISARCDDSVIVPLPFYDKVKAREGPFGNKGLTIRKSRGMIPDPLEIPHGRILLGVGAERNVSVTVSRSGRAFTSPYIGNSRHPSVLEYMEWSVERFMYLFGAEEVEAVVVDKHPRYTTRRWGSRYAEEKDLPLVEVQHHHAHAASLMADAGIERMTTVAVDGVGYGDDGTPWGGEIIFTDREKYVRVGQLEPFGIPGGDGSVYHPERIAFWLSQEAGYQMDLGDTWSMEVLANSHRRTPMTTSLGRVLDALSALMLGVTWRTYDGEPAMRLEKLLSRSRSPRYDLFHEDGDDHQVGVIDRWKTLLEEISRITGGSIAPGPNMGYDTKADLAMGLVGSIVDDMVRIAVSAEDLHGEKERPFIGLTGGVSYNVPIVRRFVDSCLERGAEPVLHSRVPPGDGGISVGQVYLGGLILER
ncbi:MAG: carbamoyltransferase HypF [Thermoplasmatota archaeon]